MSGLRKAAILLVQLGRDRAAKVISRLPEAVVEELTAEIVRLRDVPAEDAAAVLAEAHAVLAVTPDVSRGGMDLARQLLSRASATTAPTRSWSGSARPWPRCRSRACAGRTPGSC